MAKTYTEEQLNTFDSDIDSAFADSTVTAQENR